MAEEQAETAAEETTEEAAEATYDHDALQDERLEAESQRQISSWLEEKGLESPEGEAKAEEAEAEPEAEAPAEETPKEEEPQKAPASKKFLQVAKRERELFRKQQELKNKETEYKKYEQIDQAVKRGDHLQALEKLGGSYESATDQVLGRQPVNPKQADMESRLNKLESEKVQLEAQNKVNSYTNRLKTLAESKEEFGLTASMWDEASDIALETASQYAQNTGQLLDDEQLLGMVESYYATEAEKLLNHPRFRDRKQAPAVADEEPTSRPVQRKRSRTLSATTSRSSAPKKAAKDLTQDELLERALGVFRTSSRE
jgi:hypothetical protein